MSKMKPVHYITGFILLLSVLVWSFVVYTVDIRVVALTKHVNRLDAAIGHLAPEKHSRLAWGDLTPDQTIALGEALKPKKGLGRKVTLYCSSPGCHALRNDFDDAFQIAEWESNFEDRPVDSESEVGLFVGPPGLEASELVLTIQKATGLTANVVETGGIEGLGLIFGKRP